MMDMASELEEKKKRSIWGLHAFIVNQKSIHRNAQEVSWVFKIEFMQTNIQKHETASWK